MISRMMPTTTMRASSRSSASSRGLSFFLQHLGRLMQLQHLASLAQQPAHCFGGHDGQQAHSLPSLAQHAAHGAQHLVHLVVHGLQHLAHLLKQSHLTHALHATAH